MRLVPWLGRIVAACGMCAALLTATASSAGSPALWLVKGTNAKIYLFGTIHIYKQDEEWMTDTIANAFDSSNELWLEITDPLDRPTIVATVRQYGFDRDHPLSSKLSKADLARVDADARALGAPDGEADLEPLMPWLAALVLDREPIAPSKRYESNAGIDWELGRRAVAENKPLRGLEDAEKQIHFFADMSQAQQIALLEGTLDNLGKGGNTLDALAKAWRSGDVNTIARYATASRTPGEVVVRNVILLQRNERWVSVIEHRLRGTGTVFMACGAAHFAGPGSVVDLLEKDGYVVTRVE